jgi:hypothetical protein
MVKRAKQSRAHVRIGRRQLSDCVHVAVHETSAGPRACAFGGLGPEVLSDREQPCGIRGSGQGGLESSRKATPVGNTVAPAREPDTPGEHLRTDSGRRHALTIDGVERARRIAGDDESLRQIDRFEMTTTVRRGSGDVDR